MASYVAVRVCHGIMRKPQRLDDDFGGEAIVKVVHMVHRKGVEGWYQ